MALRSRLTCRPVRLCLLSISKKCSEQQNLFPTAAKKLSPLFIKISHFFLCCVSDVKLMKWYKCTCRSDRLSLLLQEAAAQHLWPLFLSFFINWLSEVALNLPTTQLPFVFPVVCTACRFLTLTKANFVWKHVSKLLFKLVVENKQHKQLIDRTKPDDVHLHVPFQQFLFITILIYTAAF